MTKTNRGVKARKASTLLAIVLLLSSVIVLAIASGMAIFYSYQTQRQFVVAQQHLIARQAANTIAGFIDKKLDELDAAVRLGIRGSTTTEEQQVTLNNLLGLDPAFRHVALLDLQGQELAWASRLSKLTAGQLAERAGSNLLSLVRQDTRQISPVYIGDVSNEPLIIMAVPVTDVFDDLQGILLAEVNLKFMWDLVEQLEVGETGSAYIVNKQGDLLAANDTSRVLRGENVKQLSQVNAFINTATGTAETGGNTFKGISGVNAVGAYVPLGTPDWAVMIELPVREAYRPVYQNSIIATVGNIVMAALASLVGAFAARRLAAPILTLTETATRIAAGEMDLQVPERGPVEVISLAQAFNSMTAQLRELIGSLQARTRALETSTQVSRRLSTILNREHLVTEVVKQVQETFDYYHTHIYLIDEATQELVLSSGSGEAGQIMLANGHKIPWGTGLTGRAAATNSTILVPDVSQEAGWLPNPLLPDTKSEVAVPIAVGEHVLGVLDVQHNIVGGLSAIDADMLQSIANQIAIALQNASMFAEAQRRAENEAFVNIINQRIQSTTTVENALQVAVSELGRALRTQRASVQLTLASDDDRLS